MKIKIFILLEKYQLVYKHFELMKIKIQTSVV